MAKISATSLYDLSVYRDAKSSEANAIAKYFKFAEIESEAKTLERYIVKCNFVMLNSSEASEANANANVPFGSVSFASVSFATLDPNFDGDRDLLRRLEVLKLALKLSSPQGD